jgi:hypothetical protein
VPDCDGSPPGGGLDRVLDGLYIASGAAAARRPDLAAVNVTHVVNAAPSVELCWHKPHLVRTQARWAARTRAQQRHRARGARDAAPQRPRAPSEGGHLAGTEVRARAWR